MLRIRVIQHVCNSHITGNATFTFICMVADRIKVFFHNICSPSCGVIHI